MTTDAINGFFTFLNTYIPSTQGFQNQNPYNPLTIQRRILVQKLNTIRFVPESPTLFQKLLSFFTGT